MAGNWTGVGELGEEKKEATSAPHLETTSAALQRRKTSPMNSEVGSEGGDGVGESGKCQGELKVSVRARCCSAITRREMRFPGVSFVILLDFVGERDVRSEGLCS